MLQRETNFLYMPNSKINMKSPLLSSLLISLFILSSCNSANQRSPADENAPASENTSMTGIDPAAKSDSKGIGKFTAVTLPAIDKKISEKGASVFESKCISCHTLTDQKGIGPGLKGITTIRTPEWIMNMIYNPEEMVKKDPVAKALKGQYKLPMMIPGGITDEECRAVLEYLRSNDQK